MAVAVVDARLGPVRGPANFVIRVHQGKAAMAGGTRRALFTRGYLAADERSQYISNARPSAVHKYGPVYGHPNDWDRHDRGRERQALS